MPRLDSSRLLFAIMCLIWGATWIAMKVGLATVPPALFAGTRFLVAGAIILVYQASRGSLAVERAHWPRLAAASLLMVALTYPLLFWAAKHISSGLAAVVDLSFLPVALLAFGIAAGEERADRGKLLALALGLVGLALLFGPKAFGSARGSAEELLGCAAILASAVVYALGSVIARPLLRAYPSLLVSGHTLFAGGLVILVASVAFEPGAREALDFRWGAPAWASWIFLVLGGSLVAFTIYLRLVRDWGPSAAGAYCFVSPAIAVLLGAVFLQERAATGELLGMGVMLAARGWRSGPRRRAVAARSRLRQITGDNQAAGPR